MPVPVAPAYPEEAFVVETGGDATAPPAAVHAEELALDLDVFEAQAVVETNLDADLAAIDEGGAASERMAPFPRDDVPEDAPLAPPPLPHEEVAEPDTGLHADPGDMPSFVRRAEREARWRRPQVRAALALGCVAAGLVLGAQWMLAQRDLVAARSPGLKPMLAAACGVLGCEVRAPHALEALRVESSGVVRVERSDLYRLSVALRNLRTHEVALPAFELALTDTQGQLIARRVLRAGELGARVGSLAAGAELTLQCTIQVAAGTVAGYTIELFYP